MDVADTRKGFYPHYNLQNKRSILPQFPFALRLRTQRITNSSDALYKLISPKVFAMQFTTAKGTCRNLFFVNNFTNHMYHIGNVCCEEKPNSFTILHPLIAETKAQRYLSPLQAQTGPAIVTDEKTIAAKAF
jgi:hypothetical protein